MSEAARGELTIQTAVRLPTELIDRIDKLLLKLRKKQRGTRVTRSDVMRVLLSRALDDAERER